MELVCWHFVLCVYVSVLVSAPSVVMQSDESGSPAP